MSTDAWLFVACYQQGLTRVHLLEFRTPNKLSYWQKKMPSTLTVIPCAKLPHCSAERVENGVVLLKKEEM